MSEPSTSTQDTPRAPRVLAVQNVKGGVGKTTIAVNLAALLAVQHKKRVLLIDADPQCNASLYLLSEERFLARTGNERREGNLYDLFHKDVEYLNVLTGKPYGSPAKKGYEESIPVSGGGSLSVVCASAELFNIQEIAPELAVSRIEAWLESKKTAYDRVIIDCPPSISSLSLSALKAADSILVPMMADQFSLHGLPVLFKHLESYRNVLGIKAQIAGVVLSMFPPSSERTARKKAEQYAIGIEKLCKSLDPDLSCLKAKISKNEAYPDSFTGRSPLPFSTDPDHKKLIAELAALAAELGLE